MRPDIGVKLPDHEEVGRALIEILRARGNRALRASDAYRLLADHFKSDWRQLHETSAIRDELKWHKDVYKRQALESVLKVIGGARGWPVKDTDPASRLIRAAVNAGFLGPVH